MFRVGWLGNASLYVAEIKGFTDIASLLKLHGVRIQVDTLSKCKQGNWEKEDRDGTGCPSWYRVGYMNVHMIK